MSLQLVKDGAILSS